LVDDDGHNFDDDGNGEKDGEDDPGPPDNKNIPPVVVSPFHQHT
jgi:hypothetical protein